MTEFVFELYDLGRLLVSSSADYLDLQGAQRAAVGMLLDLIQNLAVESDQRDLSVTVRATNGKRLCEITLSYLFGPLS